METTWLCSSVTDFDKWVFHVSQSKYWIMRTVRVHILRSDWSNMNFEWILKRRNTLFMFPSKEIRITEKWWLSLLATSPPAWNLSQTSTVWGDGSKRRNCAKKLSTRQWTYQNCIQLISVSITFCGWELTAQLSSQKKRTEETVAVGQHFANHGKWKNKSSCEVKWDVVIQMGCFWGYRVRDREGGYRAPSGHGSAIQGWPATRLGCMRRILRVPGRPALSPRGHLPISALPGLPGRAM